MIRRYELDEGNATKFWEIENRDDVSFVCRWGKVGALGRNERNYGFPDAGAATKAAAKLIAERIKNGFAIAGGKTARDAEPDEDVVKPKRSKAKIDDSEVVAKPSKREAIEVKTTAPAKTAAAGAGNPKLEAILADNPDDAGTWQVYADWLIEQGEPWGEVIAAASTGKRPKAQQEAATKELLGDLDGSSLSWRFGTIEEASLCPEENAGDGGDVDKKYAATLSRIFAHPAGRLIRVLELGLPPGQDCEYSYQPVLRAFGKANVLPLLERLDLTKDAEFMDQDSWRGIGDLGKLWAVAPRLKELHLKGSCGTDRTKLGDIVAPCLETLVHISSGLGKAVPEDIGRAHLPELKRLVLYLGQDDYGLSCKIKSFAGIFAGKGLPKLDYLALCNSEWEADLIAALAKAPIVKRLTTLDLTKGTMWRDAAAALVEHAAAFRHLEKLDLEDNYFTEEQQQAIAKAIPCVNLGEQKEIEDDDGDDDPYRYVTVGE